MSYVPMWWESRAIRNYSSNDRHIRPLRWKKGTYEMFFFVSSRWTDQGSLDAFASKFDSTAGSGAGSGMDPFGGGSDAAVDISGGFGGESFQNDSMDFLSEGIIPATQVSVCRRLFFILNYISRPLIHVISTLRGWLTTPPIVLPFFLLWVTRAYDLSDL